MDTQEMNIKEIIGQGYDEFWKSKKRYVVCKGSRASKKSTTAALKLIVRLMQYPLANAIVIRKTLGSLSNSCYAQLKWAINRLGVGAYWKCTVNPLQMTYLPTGQKILFYGLDEPQKVTSVTVDKGFLCWAWGEEFFQVEEEEFQFIDESLRGEMPEGYYIQWLITFNPIDSSSWLKARFFDEPHDNVLAMTTTYKINEWLSAADLEMFEDMKKTDPERYKVMGLAEWGIAEGQYFNQWSESKHVIEPFKIPDGWVRFRSMDWGMAKPFAVLWFAVDYDGNMYCYRELYGWGGKPNVGTGETAKEVAEKICQLEKPSERVMYGVLDSACWNRTGVSAPSISEEINNVLVEHKLMPFTKSEKGRVEGANSFKQRLVGNEMKDGTNKPAIYFFKTCFHSIRTIPMLSHDKHDPEKYSTTGEDHCFVAGTLITTKRGDVPIEEVTTDDFVLTRKGFKKVLAAGLTKKNADVMTVEFSNGKFLTGTPNHPIFLKGKGFCTLGTVNYGDIIYSVSEVGDLCRENNPIQPILLCLTVSNSGVIQIPNAMATTKNVVYAVCSSTEKRKADVYNLTVDEEHEYFANGFLVHNCADAVIYACLSRPFTPTKAKRRIDRYDRWKKPEKKRSAWTY